MCELSLDGLEQPHLPSHTKFRYINCLLQGWFMTEICSYQLYHAFTICAVIELH